MNIGCGTAMIRAGAVAFLTALLSVALVAPALAGIPQCTLQATVGGGSATEVETGEEVLIEGFGFPATVDVDLVYSVDGTPVSAYDETVTTDATGAFETTVTPLAGDEGTWTVTATVVKGCTAETGFLVVAGATPTPSPTPTPTPSPTPGGALPNAATDEPDGPSAPVLAGLLVLCATAWIVSRRTLARRVR